MAPFTFTPWTSAMITVIIGFFFGFVLERAGFGISRNLAAQFYFYDMRVLKVMFTAIVTAMLLIFLASALGFVDFSRVWVPPTYLGPAVVGGFLLGVGFIIGGYCPGTSLVAAATFKLDGIVYVGGVLFGLLMFGETAPAFWGFFNHAGSLGRLTLYDLLGVDAGVVVLGVVLMAIGAFGFAEIMERIFAQPHGPGTGSFFSPSRPEPSIRLKAEKCACPLTALWVKYFRRAAVATALTIAVATLLIGQPSAERKIAWASKGLDQSIQERKIHIDPAELLGLMHNNQARLVMADVRRPSDFNLFHLLDAQNVNLRELDSGWATNLPPAAIVIVMSNDERAANEAWKHLAVQLNPDPQLPVADKSRVYVLAGGVNRWLDIYQRGQADSPGPETAATGDDTCRHRFATALGSRIACARPTIEKAPRRTFVAKVRAVIPTHHAAGGCG